MDDFTRPLMPAHAAGPGELQKVLWPDLSWGPRRLGFQQGLVLDCRYACVHDVIGEFYYASHDSLRTEASRPNSPVEEEQERENTTRTQQDGLKGEETF